MQEGLLYKYRKIHDKIIANIEFAVYFIFALGIFIILGNILSSYPICAKFVNFMKQYFPNVQIFSDVSPFKQEIEFYTSYMWVIGLLWAAEMAFYATCCYTIFYREDKELQEKVKSFSWPLLIFAFGMSIFGIYVYYTGYIVTGGVSFMAWSIEIDFATKFEIFQYILLFQAIFMFGVAMFVALFYTLFYKIYEN